MIYNILIKGTQSLKASPIQSVQMVQLLSLPLKKRKLRHSISNKLNGFDHFSSEAKVRHAVRQTVYLREPFVFLNHSINEVEGSSLECKGFKKRKVEPEIVLKDQCPLWFVRYEQLKEFKRKNGHCHVPQRYSSNKALGKWVHNHRHMARHGLCSGNMMRFQALERIGFWLDPPDRLELVWKERFIELLEYKKKYGNFSIPQRYPLNRSLGIWVHRQRGELKKMFQGKTSRMTSPRARKLLEVGFERYIHFCPS